MHPSTPAAELPQSVQQIADVIGRDEALDLVARLPRHFQKHHPTGRVLLYVPKALPDGHRLVDLLGRELAEQLVAAFGGEILYPAACVAMSRARRKVVIREQVAQGVAREDIAKSHGITERQLRNILQEIRTEERNAGDMQHAA